MGCAYPPDVPASALNPLFRVRRLFTAGVDSAPRLSGRVAPEENLGRGAVGKPETISADGRGYGRNRFLPAL
jgi:hypothetical protein